MTLRCKQGDLAVVVKSAHDNEGQIVLCVRLVNSYLQSTPGREVYATDGWEIDPPIPSWGGPGGCWIVPDSSLRPIRNPGLDAVDQTLEWVGAPDYAEVNDEAPADAERVA